MLERGRIEWREQAKTAPREGDALQCRGAHARSVHQIPGSLRVEERGVDRRIGIGAGDVRENPFRAAALVQIVVDESDARSGGRSQIAGY